MRNAAFAGFSGQVAGTHHIENRPAGNRRPEGGCPWPLPRLLQTIHIFWTKLSASAKNGNSGILRAKDRLNSPEPDDLKPKA
ncbi:MAG: hypothetical protein HY082_02625 [Gammaproteobacteria bacterium]|nr:hypothetical protein [Gammaproteobacteria bacterium]